MIRDGENVKHAGYITDIITDLSLEWLEKRDKSKPFLLMCQHKAPHREWSPALRHLGHNGDRVYPEPDTLFDDYAGRGMAEREQDMTHRQDAYAARRQTRHARRSSRPNSSGHGTPITSRATRRSDKAQSAGHGISCAGDINATCTITSAASRRSTKASAACSSTWTTKGLADNTIVVYARTKASTWASMAGSTSAGSSRSRCARRCSSAGRASPRPAA